VISGRTPTLSNLDASWVVREALTDSNVSIVLKAEDSTQDDDDFQIQATPPHQATTTSKRVPSKHTDDNSTDNDDDLDAPSQRSKIPDGFPSSPPPAISPPKQKSLGRIGGKKAAPKPASSVDEETTDGEPSSPVELNPEKASPVPEHSMPKKKRALGRIGGKKEPPPVSRICCKGFLSEDLKDCGALLPSTEVY
jgi:hypothetical protein